jgi:phosphoesterase RecJ-like protein
MEVVKHLKKIEDKIYLSYLTPEDLTKHCASKEDIDGVVNYLKNIEGAEIVGLLYQSQYGYKLSLRSNAPYNVAEVCQTFGGGGHKYAAGATFAGDLENIYHMVKAALLKLLS